MKENRSTDLERETALQQQQQQQQQSLKSPQVSLTLYSTAKCNDASTELEVPETLTDYD
jgi:hypothetical protein